MDLAESWKIGAFIAVFLGVLATSAFANAMNQVIGVPYVATYDVTEKFINRRKRPCYGLTVAKVGDSLDQFQFCVSQSEQEQMPIGAKLHVNGRRSRFINQLVSFTRKP